MRQRDIYKIFITGQYCSRHQHVCTGFHQFPWHSRCGQCRRPLPGLSPALSCAWANVLDQPPRKNPWSKGSAPASGQLARPTFSLVRQKAMPQWHIFTNGRLGSVKSLPWCHPHKNWGLPDSADSWWPCQPPAPSAFTAQVGLCMLWVSGAGSVKGNPMQQVLTRTLNRWDENQGTWCCWFPLRSKSR